MKSAFKLALLLAFLAPVLAFGSDRLFTTVPAGDATYVQLKRLEDLGLLPRGASRAELTRYEVAQLLFRAKREYANRYRAGVQMVQAGAAIPPPPLDDADISTQAVTDEPEAASIQAAASTITTLEEAYAQELSALQADVKASTDRVKALEGEQFKLWRRLRALDNSTAIYLNGLGRAFGHAGAEGEDSPGPRHVRTLDSYLDLNPRGVVSKEVKWSAIFRVSSNVSPQTAKDLFSIRRARLEFNPAWMSCDLGDFEESYTPLTLWNRNPLDLRFTPDVMGRLDRYERYEGFLDRDEYLPFRGARFGTAVMWPKSEALESLKGSVFVHMINNGYVNGAYTAHGYTGWVFGGRAVFKARKFFEIDAQGLMLDEPLDTDDPGSAYGRFDTTTWAQRYQVGSLRPVLSYGIAKDVTIGVRYEMAYSIYNDDKRDAAKTIEDYARLGGPFLSYGKSTLQFNFVDNAAAYFSPLAQMRTEGVTVFPGLTSLPRAGGIFAYYDRRFDNVFPYGLSTPNRKGGGVEADFQALEREALKIKLSAYTLREHRGNLVIDEFFTEYVPVDGLANSPAAVRSFNYVNVGPSLDLAPLMSLKHSVVVGLNFRSEKTESWIGELKSDWIGGGVKAGLKKWWTVSMEGASMTSKGREAYLNGFEARYSYLFDNSDLGDYGIVNSETTSTLAQASTSFEINRNSTLILDGYLRTDRVAYPDADLDTTVKKSGGRMVYEIRF